MIDFKPLEEDWTDDGPSQYQKGRHDLPTDRHVLEIETIPADDEYDEERDVTISHPAQCSDDAACEFDDFDPGWTDGMEDGKHFVSLKWSQNYWGESDVEIIVHEEKP